MNQLEAIIVGNNESAQKLIYRLKKQGLSRLLQLPDASQIEQQTAVWRINGENGADLYTRHLILTSVAQARRLLGDGIPNQSFIEKEAQHSLFSLWDWPEALSIAGKKVALLGGGNWAVALAPELIKRGAQLKVFQRMPVPVVPTGLQKPTASINYFTGLKPSSSAALRSLSNIYLNYKVKDPWIRRQLSANQRSLFPPTAYSDEYYQLFSSGKAKLITWPVVQLVAQGIQTAEGLIHEADIVVDGLLFEHIEQFNVSMVPQVYLVHDDYKQLPRVVQPDLKLKRQAQLIAFQIKQGLNSSGAATAY